VKKVKIYGKAMKMEFYFHILLPNKTMSTPSPWAEHIEFVENIYARFSELSLFGIVNICSCWENKNLQAFVTS
jgi:hypothetical protein